MRTLVTETPCLDMAELKKRGLFEIDSSVEMMVRNRASEFFVQRLVEQTGVTVRFQSESGSGSEKINIVSTMLKHGERKYFECPKTKERALKLFILGRELASAKGLNLVHASRAAKKDLLQNDLYADFRLATRNPCSTESGLARGGSEHIRDQELIKSLLDTHKVGNLQSPASFKEFSNKAFNAVLPQVNICSLIKNHIVEMDEFNFVDLNFRRGDYSRDMIRITMVFDLRNGSDSEIRYSIKMPDEPSTYGFVEIEKVAGRITFICPITREATNTLHLREGRLGSAKGLAIRKSALKTGRWIGEPR